MGRKSSIDEAAIFAAVGQQLSGPNAFSLQAVSAQTGVSIGSIYHRFGNKDGLLAETWLAANQSFRTLFLERFQNGGGDAGLAAALSIPMFCRNARDQAVVLICNRPRDLLGQDIAPEIGAALAEVRAEVASVVSQFAKTRAISNDLANLALIEMPRAVVGLYLPSRDVPAAADTYIQAAFAGLMAQKLPEMSLNDTKG